ncbi:MAG: hypoxanthine phosphoribosyltransferase [Mycoplasmataceae bacterium]|nr:hypoxanthine phosphoribosyltransferase [Mycoplasmataceae bacterium]
MDKKYIKDIIISKEEIKAGVKKLALKINEEYKGKTVVAVGLLKGVFIFISDIVRELDLDVEIEFIIVKSYSNGKSNNKPKILLDIKKDITGKDIIIFEDIIDTGKTLAAVKEYLKYKGANSIKIASLLTKPSRRMVHVEVDYELFVVPNEIVVGYGLDYNEKGRHLKDIVSINDLAIEELKK